MSFRILSDLEIFTECAAKIVLLPFYFIGKGLKNFTTKIATYIHKYADTGRADFYATKTLQPMAQGQ
ncbi:MAG: hypothetical protein A2W23_02635 [Planctomycetes bacterium RBG_16_43_13]|nr:MAG: hypothetical protein A2W23_02635 [Planctomycetes bacterium RBG_16_43_13]